MAQVLDLIDFITDNQEKYFTVGYLCNRLKFEERLDADADEERFGQYVLSESVTGSRAFACRGDLAKKVADHAAEYLAGRHASTCRGFFKNFGLPARQQEREFNNFHIRAGVFRSHSGSSLRIKVSCGGHMMAEVGRPEFGPKCWIE